MVEGNIENRPLSREVPVSCMLCGKQIPCPADQVMENHACFECFSKRGSEFKARGVNKVHVAIPTERALEAAGEMMLKDIMKEAFPIFWKDYKHELKGCSSQEIAKAAFEAGAGAAIIVFIHSAGDDNAEDEEEEERYRELS